MSFSVRPVREEDAGAIDAHRRGVGRLLTDATLREARRLGYARLAATIRAGNPGAVAFYRSRGFVADVGAAGPAGAVRLVRALA